MFLPWSKRQVRERRWVDRERSWDIEGGGSHSGNSWAVWADFQQSVCWLCQTDKLSQCMGTVPGGGQPVTSSWPCELFLYVFPLWPRFLFFFLSYSHFFLSHFISAMCYLLVILCFCFPISTGPMHSHRGLILFLFHDFGPVYRVYSYHICLAVERFDWHV